MRKQEYALYKGDEFIDLGTVAELAKRNGLSESTIRFYSRPAYLKRIKKKDKCLIVIKIID